MADGQQHPDWEEEEVEQRTNALLARAVERAVSPTPVDLALSALRAARKAEREFIRTHPAPGADEWKRRSSATVTAVIALLNALDAEET